MGNVVRRAGIVTLVVIAATMLWLHRLDRRQAPLAVAGSARPITNVVVATRRIEAGEMIEPTFIKVARRPAGPTPDEAFSHVDNVMGRIAKVNIDPGEVITTARLAGPFTIKDLANAKRTVRLPVDSRASDLSIQPNTRADLMVVPALGDQDRADEAILEGVTVVRIESGTENRRSATWYPITIATIEVTIEQQERLATALAGRPWRIGLRRHADSPKPVRLR